MTRNARKLATVLALIIATTGVAQADVPERGFYIGVYGGGNFVLDDWDLYKVGDGGISPNHSATFGVRLGGHLTWWLAIEGALGVLPYTSDADETNIAMNYSLDLLFHLMRGSWVPFIDVGGGGYHNVSGDHGEDIDYHLHYGLGLRGMLHDYVALRIDVRHILTDGFDDSSIAAANNIEATIGFDFYLTRNSEEEPVKDRDKDGIVDSVDSCPDEKGPEATQGCPDTDGDGIADREDKCKRTPGPKSTQGCPDTDGDGIVDNQDSCPKKRGPKSLNGCPDSDGDGIADAQDRCPNDKGGAAHKGCPDSDGDGIADIDDKCPKTPGIKSEQGCLPKAVAEKFSGALEGIFFKTGSAKIKRKSFKVLNGAVAILKQYPSVRIRIEGYTDAQGPAIKNKALSKARALSVRDYMVKKGIALSRLHAIGLGEDKPRATNKTRKGRAKNRRIEFRVIAK